MTRWYSGWQNAALRAADIPLSQFAKDVLNLWAESTPLELWTNNPVGMPQRGHSVLRVPNTAYASFPDMQAFRNAFCSYLATPRGKALYAVLANAESLPAAWREIHALKWPANTTETDHPSALLDRLEADQAKRIRAKSSGKRKSSGTVNPQPDLHAQVVHAHRVMANAVNNTQSAEKMIHQIIKGIG
jgi:hypothetical protein